MASVPRDGLDDIRAFVAVADARSVSRSARELHLTQPAVSRRVQRLGTSLGVILCDRRRRPFALTAAELTNQEERAMAGYLVLALSLVLGGCFGAYQVTADDPTGAGSLRPTAEDKDAAWSASPPGSKAPRLEGAIPRFGEGSQAARAMVGLYGAGKARAQGDMTFRDAQTGRPVMVTADRRVAQMGFFGGDRKDHLRESFDDRLNRGEAPRKN